MIGIILIILATYFYPNFSWISNTISNMGNVSRGRNYGSASLLNGAYVLSGLGTFPLFFYYGIKFKNSHIRSLRIGGKIFFIPPLDIAFLGIASENFGTLHIIVSNLFFLTFSLSLLFIGVGLLKIPRERRLVLLNFIIIFTGLGLWLIYFTIFQGTEVNQAIFEFATVIEFAIIIFAYSYKGSKGNSGIIEHLN